MVDLEGYREEEAAGRKGDHLKGEGTFSMTG
jgi:hypothetical protein